MWRRARMNQPTQLHSRIGNFLHPDVEDCHGPSISTFLALLCTHSWSMAMIALKRTNKGITLIELIMTIAIVSVLASIAYPSLSDLRQAGATRAARSGLMVAISQARSTAIMQQRQVIACPSANQLACSRDLKWHHGWLVFVDENRNQERDETEALVAVGQATAGGVAILSSRGRYQIRYQPDGTADGSNLTLTVCDRRGQTKASSLVMNNSGRLRSGTPSPAQAAAACAAIDN